MRRPRWLGPYQLLYRISSGGMAEIYRGVIARDGDEHAPVAIKQLLPFYTSDPDFIDMLIDEARITGLFDHHNIARVFEFGVVDDTYFLAMEFIDGHDLRSALRRCRSRGLDMPVEYGIFCVEKALRGLHSAHEQCSIDGRPLEIVHRDFSPSNILIDYDGHVKLIDFGIAKANLRRVKTRVGIIKGKVKYMSPEQTVGRRLDRRSDVFAAGVVLYEAVTGNVPFHAPDDVSVMEAIRTQQPDPTSAQNPRINAAFDAIIEIALRKRREERFDTAESFADALEHFRCKHFPRFYQAHLGGFLSRIFAGEKAEAVQRFRSYDLNALPDDDTATGLRTQYTRLVDVAGLTPPPIPPEPEPEHVLRLDALTDEYVERLLGPAPGEIAALDAVRESKAPLDSAVQRAMETGDTAPHVRVDTRTVTRGEPRPRRRRSEPDG